MTGDENPQPANAAEALERLGRLSLRELSMDSLLQAVADLTKTVMPGRPETSVTLLVRDKPTLMASTGRLAVDLDERQYERDHGPCLHAARSGEVVEVADARTDGRWRDYLSRAVATRFGTYAAVAAGNLYAYQSVRDLADTCRPRWSSAR